VRAVRPRPTATIGSMAEEPSVEEPRAAAGEAADDGSAQPAEPAVQGHVSEDDVYEALEEIIDPELGLDFVSLGLIYDVEIKDGDVHITFTLTTPACPIGPQVTEQMREFVGAIDGVRSVHPKMVFDPPWTPEMMSEDAKFALGY